MRHEDVRAEQQAFEAWAGAQGYDMAQHPLHYLFLDPKTNAARKAWNASISAVAPLIAAMKREECAEMLQQMLDGVPNGNPRSYEMAHYCMGLEAAIAAIRARGTP